MKSESLKYQTLGTVCDIISGQDYKNVQADNGKYPIYGTGGIMGYANQYRCPARTIIIGRKGNINNPLYVEEEFWNVDTAFGVVPRKDLLCPKYFFYFCKNYDFTKHDVSVTIPSLRRTDIIKIKVPVPPLAEQERIVAELDLLTEIIDKQKAQLKELDTLAQSIFYDMFGDPVENEKGWEISDFGSISNNYDFKRKPITKEERIAGIYPYYGASGIVDYVEDYLFDGNFLLISEDGANLLARSTPIAFSIAGKNWVNNHAHVIEFQEYSTQIFCEHLFNLLDIGCYVSGTAQPKLTQGALNNIRIPVPPLSLQQSFADKINVIEQQKAAITQSIAETQKLFDYTMDKYFG